MCTATTAAVPPSFLYFDTGHVYSNTLVRYIPLSVGSSDHKRAGPDFLTGPAVAVGSKV